MSDEIFNRDDWWDADGAFRMLHDINPLRLRWAQSVGGAVAGRRLLDVGCGGGIFAESAVRAGAKVTGVDAAESAIACARAHAAAEGLTVDYRHGNSAPADIGEFDMVTCFEMLEHSARPADIVADIAAALAPGGAAFFSTINRTPAAYALVIVGLERIARALPAGTHTYPQFIRPDELARYCRDAGLQVTDITGMRYSFFGKSYFLDQTNTAVNYFLSARRP